MAFKIFVLVVYTFISVVLFVNFDTTPLVWTSFFSSALVLYLITLHHLFIEKQFSPFISCFIVFSFLFFLVAPIVQINSFEGLKPSFMQNLPFKSSIAIQTNVFIIVFNVVFYLFYIGLKKWNKANVVPQERSYSHTLRPYTIFIIAVVVVGCLVLSLPFMVEEIRRPNWQESGYSTGMLLIWKKVLFLIPFAGIVLSYRYLKTSKKNVFNYVIILTLFCFFFISLLWFKNPLVEKRNALGPIYICIIFLIIPRLLNSNVKTLFFMFFSMIIVFPLSAILTHSNYNFKEILSDPSVLFDEMGGKGIADTFNTLHYDAFANIMATIDYVQLYGFEMGNQLLSAFLFYVPRSLWEGKPLSTGQLVGEHLIETHNFTFSNLSNPYISEGYINFGIIGIIIAAIALSYVCTRLVAWIKSNDYLKKIMAYYFAIHLIFLLRGDFTNGFSYYIGTLVGVVLIPKFISYLINQMVTYRAKWRNTAAI